MSCSPAIKSPRMVMALRPAVLGCVAGSLAACALAWTVNAQQPAADAAAPGAAPRDLVARYCVSCHSDRLKAGGLALEAVAAHDVAQSPDVWEKVVRKLRARQMPPVGTPRPDEATYDAAIASLETALDRAAAAAPNPGRTETFRRLNRTEYQNAIRDLLALEVDVDLAAAGRRIQPRLRQRDGRRSLADAAGTLPLRGAEDQPAGGRTSQPVAGRRHDQASARPHAGRALRRAAARHARRRGRPLHVPAGRRVRDPDSAGARPQRARRRV